MLADAHRHRHTYGHHLTHTLRFTLIFTNGKSYCETDAITPVSPDSGAASDSVV